MSTPVAGALTGYSGDETFIAPTPTMPELRQVDVVVLALPNGMSDEYLPAIDGTTTVVDLSADHRFDDDWVYGLPELHRGDLAGARRIANPGCYATAAMLALAPIESVLDADPAVFGVSGFSGAGSDPSPKNDPEILRENVLPYTITGHVHEREIGYQIGRTVRFAPSVAPFVRGLVVTVLASAREALTSESLAGRFAAAYETDRMIEITNEVPLPRDAAFRVGALIGGFSVDPDDGRRIGVVAALDNLLKGAASQAIQNINLARGLGEHTGLLD